MRLSADCSNSRDRFLPFGMSIASGVKFAQQTASQRASPEYMGEPEGGRGQVKASEAFKRAVNSPRPHAAAEPTVRYTQLFQICSRVRFVFGSSHS